MTDAHAALADYDRVSALGVQVPPYRLAEALRETLVALADRDARIEAALDKLDAYGLARIHGIDDAAHCHARDAHRILTVPAAPVPQDNPEATRAYLAQPTMCAWCRQPAVGYAWVNGEWVCEPCQHARPKNGES